MAETTTKPEAQGLYRFRVPEEMSPGVYRHTVGFFEPGKVLTLPDDASVEGEIVSSKLIPLDDASRDWLIAAHKRGAEQFKAQKAEQEARKTGSGLPPMPKIAEVPKTMAALIDKGDSAPSTLREIGERSGEIPVAAKTKK